jgi:hypothetical protein
VFGTDLSVKPTMRQVNALTYVQQMLKETLRLWPTAPAFALCRTRTRCSGGKYASRRARRSSCCCRCCTAIQRVGRARRDLRSRQFHARAPRRARPVNAYKPFGNGQRACIGRQFAMQEATLVIAMMLQRFRLIDHQRYTLRIKETLTIKPEGLQDQGSPARSPARSRPRRSTPENGAPQWCRARRRAARATAGAEARHAAARAVRLEPRDVGRHRAPGRRSRHRARLRRAHRRGSTTSSGSCPPTAACSSCARRTTARRPTTPPRSTSGCRRPGARRAGRREVRRVRLRQPQLGVDLSSRAALHRRTKLAQYGASGCSNAARATRATISTRSSAPGASRCGSRSRRRSASRSTRRRRPTRGRCTRSSSSTDRRPTRWPPRTARARCGSSSTASCKRGTNVRRGTSKSRLPPGTTYGSAIIWASSPSNPPALVARVLRRFGFERRHVRAAASPFRRSRSRRCRSTRAVALGRLLDALRRAAAHRHPQADRHAGRAHAVPEHETAAAAARWPMTRRRAHTAPR